ncbi:RCC1 domain-containing protein 1 [Clarias gariepinus]|uniref:RCC1 domain-containing protein 1 n=1 Tax=Clarias gariepinus TaxID=13013 RepID=UPI00234D9ACA|nr:RCC1 domain-containing protein 1 [Clarias gariepinus]
MNWFGFGFNGFGQIEPQRNDEQKDIKVLRPVALGSLCACAESGLSRTGSSPKQKTQTWKVVASWSRSAIIHRTGDRQCVCVHGVEGSVLVSESEGCEDAVLTESCLTLSFTHTVQCWSLHRKGRALVWSEKLNSTEKTGNALALPLVPGGYIASKPPFFRPLSLHLQAASLALGTEHAVLLTASGTVYTWGHGSHGQLGQGTLVSGDEPQAVEALWGVPMKSVAAGGWHSACISAGGDLYVWGWNESGQIGLPSKGLREESQREEERIGETDKVKENIKKDEGTTDVFISIQAFPALVDVSEASEISMVSCGSRHTAAITSTGDLYTWGWGLYGQLGHGSRCSSDEPKIVEFFTSAGMSVRHVSCGLWNTFVAAVPRDPVAP